MKNSRATRIGLALTICLSLMTLLSAAQLESISSLKNKFKNAINRQDISTAIRACSGLFDHNEKKAVDAALKYAMMPNWLGTLRSQ